MYPFTRTAAFVNKGKRSTKRHWHSQKVWRVEHGILTPECNLYPIAQPTYAVHANINMFGLKSVRHLSTKVGPRTPIIIMDLYAMEIGLRGIIESMIKSDDPVQAVISIPVCTADVVQLDIAHIF